MSNQELLQVYSSYLPYGVKYMRNGKLSNREIEGISIDSWTNALKKDYDIKLVLRPLSDLAKEIEHNGGRFIPIELIGKLFIEKGGFYEGFFGWNLPTGGDDYQDYYLTIEQKEENLWMNTWCGRPDEGGYEIESHVLEYTAFLQLIKWHFDVFGLIEKGLAINLNEVK